MRSEYSGCRSIQLLMNGHNARTCSPRARASSSADLAIAPPTPCPSYFWATTVCRKMMVLSANSYSETPPSAPSIRASYLLTRGLSSTVTLTVAHCARRCWQVCLGRVLGKNKSIAAALLELRLAVGEM